MPHFSKDVEPDKIVVASFLPGDASRRSELCRFSRSRFAKSCHLIPLVSIWREVCLPTTSDTRVHFCDDVSCITGTGVRA